MNFRVMNAGSNESRFASAARIAVGAVIVVGILFIGYSAPVANVMANDASVATSAEQYDNGPTGYFPDMFQVIERAAEPSGHVEAF